MTTDRLLLIVILFVAVVNTLLLVALLVSKWWIRNEFIATIAQARAEGTARYEETVTLLAAVRDMAKSARDNRKETAAAVEKVKEKLTEHPSREDLATKLEKVPEETARKLLEVLPPTPAPGG